LHRLPLQSVADSRQSSVIDSRRTRSALSLRIVGDAQAMLMVVKQAIHPRGRRKDLPHMYDSLD
jgi:hypothetical protein